MESKLFRKSSLERLSSAEDLNAYARITRPEVWAVLLGCIALLSAAAFWAVTGVIPDTMSATGTIFPEEGVVAVVPIAGGRITDMLVKVGDYVELGQIVAVIPQDGIIDQIKAAESSGSEDAVIEALRADYIRQSVVVSPANGIVLSARGANETVSSAERIAIVVRQEKYADDRQILSYIPSVQAKRLRRGMEVQVSPDFAPREEYGYMYGTITSIGTYPASAEDVLSAVGSEPYAKGLMQEGDCVEVRITLTVDPDSKNGIKWSNPKGERLALSIGTDVNLLIVVNNQRPYELIFK